MMEESKTREHKTDTLKPYYDAVRSKEIRDGIEWSYMKDGKVEDTAFMSYKQLYEIQIEKNTLCQFCGETDTEFIRPREQDTGIYLCTQHLKYISRISEKEHGNRYYYIRKSDHAKIDMDLAYKINPEVLSKEYVLYDSAV